MGDGGRCSIEGRGGGGGEQLASYYTDQAIIAACMYIHMTCSTKHHLQLEQNLRASAISVVTVKMQVLRMSTQLLVRTTFKAFLTNTSMDIASISLPVS